MVQHVVDDATPEVSSQEAAHDLETWPPRNMAFIARVRGAQSLQDVPHTRPLLHESESARVRDANSAKSVRKPHGEAAVQARGGKCARARQSGSGRWRSACHGASCGRQFCARPGIAWLRIKTSSGSVVQLRIIPWSLGSLIVQFFGVPGLVGRQIGFVFFVFSDLTEKESGVE